MQLRFRDLSPWRVLAFLFGGSVVGGVAALLKVPDWTVWVFQRLVVAQTTEQLTPSTFGATAIIVGVVALAGFLAWATSKYRTERRRGAVDVIQAAGELYDALTREGSKVRITDVEWVLTVRRDFTIETTYEWTWEAVDTELSTWGAQRASANVPVVGFDLINFRAEVLKGPGQIIVIPTQDESNQKRFLLFPTPPLQPGAGGQRVRVTSQWPECARKLQDPGLWDRNGWTASPRCAEPINCVTVKLIFPDDGRRYVVKSTGLVPTTATSSVEKWEAEYRDVKPGTEVAVLLQRTRQS